ncbi:hypothetical protein SAMN05216475_3974 [Pseudomonas synxantha]|uniref:Type III secretion effector protein n=1 Tax=Pseudomonas synxantha TaxID=47883 RepID=A0AAX3ICY0_9PSED|nr:hypothetical protein [Pseudomonas synxantha]AZE65599.1 hypothetical protein C4K01_1387 [Pseudomonas synxantha]KRP56622.1 type III secretion protein [Pseudomonas synxantha]MBI6565588.1 type III secretion protein [Pseudomonas synxantha]MBI6581865.1 type III secretion protein [Pseudomonas synxantha]MBI6645168.1 type III secretion protein [Pseudomonas synxantha]
MLLQALGNFYTGIGMLLGGGLPHKHLHNDSVSRRELTEALASFKYDHSQPKGNITINNSIANANANANSNTQMGRSMH